MLLLERTNSERTDSEQTEETDSATSRPRRLAPSLLFSQLYGENSIYANLDHLTDDKKPNRKHRKRRSSLSTIITLLWPQVVGPIENGKIAEKTYDEIPKTVLEHYLDHIRAKAKSEDELRKEVREFMQNFAAQYPNFNYKTFTLAHPELKPENPVR